MDAEIDLHLRPASLEDAKMLLEWRNDEETRKNSRKGEEISWEEHRRWLADSLSSLSRKIYIAEEQGKPIGVIRGDKGAAGVELSWAVAAEARGHGYGQAMVLQFVREVFPEEKLWAVIEEGNRASEKVAEALGLYKGERCQNCSRAFMIWR